MSLSKIWKKYHPSRRVKHFELFSHLHPRHIYKTIHGSFRIEPPKLRKKMATLTWVSFCTNLEWKLSDRGHPFFLVLFLVGQNCIEFQAIHLTKWREQIEVACSRDGAVTESHGPKQLFPNVRNKIEIIKEFVTCFKAVFVHLFLPQHSSWLASQRPSDRAWYFILLCY